MAECRHFFHHWATPEEKEILEAEIEACLKANDAKGVYVGMVRLMEPCEAREASTEESEALTPPPR